MTILVFILEKTNKFFQKKKKNFPEKRAPPVSCKNLQKTNEPFLRKMLN